MEICNGRIKLQEQITFLEMPERLNTSKELQKKLGLLNYTRPYINILSKIVGPLFTKTSTTCL